jgi:hypothetical protein
MAALVAGTSVGGAVAAEPSAAAGPDLATSPAEVQISIVSWDGWIFGDALYFVGEVRNTSPYRVNGYVTVRVTPGNSSSEAAYYDTVGLGVLAPGGRSPFLIVEDPFTPDATDVIEITAGGYVVGNPSAAIGVSRIGPVTSDPTLGTGTGDAAQIQVRNGTDRPVRILRSVAAFRGTDGKVSNMAKDETADRVLAPGATLEYSVGAPPTGVAAVTADVDVMAQFDDGATEVVVSWQNWFHDVGSSSLKSSIAWLAERGITAGCAPFRFCPTANVTRAQMAMFLDRAFELPAATRDYFTDDNGKTGEGSINRLAESGITGGCAPGRFCPTANVTRAQMAMFLDRALVLPPATRDWFDDDDGKTGEGAINRLAESGITGGCATRRYCPSAYVTRAQMAAFLKRALE